MPDEIIDPTPGQQTPVPGQQGIPDGFVPQARLTGAMQKLQAISEANATLTTTVASLQERLDALSQEKSTLETGFGGQLKTKDENITTLQAQLNEAMVQNTSLASFKKKVDAAKTMNRPDLLPILEHLPADLDGDALTAAITDLAGFADEAAKKREAQLLAGVTLTPVTNQTGATPQSEQGWMKYIEGFGLGTTERQNAMDRFGDWLEAKNKS